MIPRWWTRFRVWSGICLAGVGTYMAQPCWPYIGWGSFFLMAGVLWRLWAAGYIHKDRELTLDGPYGGHRHPLYFGTFLMGIGLAMMVHQVLFWGIILGYLLVVYGVTIRQEEEKLVKSFGDRYRDYQERVPLWWPLGWLNPGRPRSNEPLKWTWLQVKENREWKTSMVVSIWIIFFWIWWVLDGKPFCQTG